MKRLLALVAACAAFSTHAADICDKRVDFAQQIAVAKAKKLDERYVTEAAVTDPNASFQDRLWRLEIIQVIYLRFNGPVSPEQAAKAARDQCEADPPKSKVH